MKDADLGPVTRACDPACLVLIRAVIGHRAVDVPDVFLLCVV